MLPVVTMRFVIVLINEHDDDDGGGGGGGRSRKCWMNIDRGGEQRKHTD